MSAVTELTIDELEEAILGAASWALNEGDHESYDAACDALSELVRLAKLNPLKDTP